MKLKYFEPHPIKNTFNVSINPNLRKSIDEAIFPLDDILVQLSNLDYETKKN